MTPIYTLLHLLLSLISPLHPASAPEDHDCATTGIHEELMQQDSAYANETIRLEEAWGKHAPNTDKQAAPPFVLPIVFHIIHEDGPENIPDADVVRSVDRLNQAMANTGFYDPTTGVETQISVCLARRTPANEGSNGITRHRSPFTNIDMREDRMMKQIAVWNTNDYVNVYVVKEICRTTGCSVAGYANLPGAHGRDFDGIVIEARWLNRGEAELSVLTHELGHYLGLRHTFLGGCNNNDCRRSGDSVCDTPPDQSTAYAPCSAEVNTCSTDTDSGFTTDQPDMTINYMDYSPLRCQTAFTAGQRERMHFFLEGRRRSLLESLGCKDPCPALVAAETTPGDQTIEAGNTINFTNQSSGANRYSWSVNGAVVSSQTNFSRTFNQPGVYRVKLVAYSANGALCLPDSTESVITVTCPVTAGFSVSGFDLQVGDTLRVVNNSTGGTSRRWTVNDSLVSTDRTFTLPLIADGLYQVCLTEVSPFCEDRRCLRVFAAPPPCTGPDCTTDCGAPFVARYEPPQRGTSTFNAVISVTGGFIIGGSNDQQPLIMRTDERGRIIWQQRLFTEFPTAYLSGLTLGPDGEVAGVGNGRESSDFVGAFYFALDQETGNVTYVHQTQGDHAPDRLDRIFYLSATNSYLAYGTRTLAGVDSPTTVTINRTSPSDATAANLDLTGYITDAVQGTDERTYAVGYFDDTFRSVFLTERGHNGALIRTRIMEDRPTTGRLPEPQIAIANNEVIVAYNYDGVHKVIKFNSIGDVESRHAYPINDSAAPPPEELLVNENGFLLMSRIGTTTGHAIHYHQINTDGSSRWKYAYDQFGSVQLRTKTQALQTGNNLIWPSVNSGAQAQLLRLSADFDGLLSCSPLSSVDTDGQPAGLSFFLTSIPENDVFLQTFELGGAPADLVLGADYCTGECDEIPEDELPCLPTFERTYDPGEAGYRMSDPEGLLERFTNVVPHRNGVFATLQNEEVNVVVSLAESGAVNWTVNIDSLAGGSIRNMKLDSRGYLIGTGVTPASFAGRGQTSTSSFIFRILPETGIIDWLQNYYQPGELTHANMIYETSPGGDYLISGSKFSPGQNNVLNAHTVRISRQDGSPVSSFVNLDLTRVIGDSDFSNSVYDSVDQKLYLFGYVIDRSRSRFTPNIICVNQNLRVSWSKIYPNEDLYDRVVGCFPQENQILMFSTVNRGPIDNRGNFVVSRLSKSGEVVSSEKISLPAFFRVRSVVKNLNGFLVHGQYAAGTNPSSAPEALIQLDENGNFTWARAYRNVGSPDNSSNIAAFGKNIYYAPAGWVNFSASLFRLRPNGTSAEGCLPNTPLNARREPVVMTAENFAIERTSALQGFQRIGGTSALQLTLLDNTCQESCCPPIDFTLDWPADTTLCPGDFLVVPADLPDAFNRVWSDGSQGDTLFIEAAGTYGLTVFNECLDTLAAQLSVHLRPRPTFNLGPDTTLCQNGTLTLTAPDGFAEFQWSDFSTDTLFTTDGEGLFWLTATDSCGNVQTDTVQVTFSAETTIDLGPDQIICPGDVLTFSLPNFTDHQWSRNSFVNCFDCPEIEFAPTMDTVLLVAARSSAGCYGSDSLRVQVSPEGGSYQAAGLCPGDSIRFGDRVVRESGRYFITSGNNACPIVDTLDVTVFRDTMLQSSQTICAGDSALIFGVFERESGRYEDIQTSMITGCDSTIVVDLTVVSTSQSILTVARCVGDSVLVAGSYRTQPGSYVDTLTSLLSGCDSLSVTNLEFDDLSATAEVTTAACAGAGAGAAKVDWSNTAGPVAITWSNGDTTAEVTNLAAGTYGVTVTSTAGCESVDEVFIPVPEANNLALPDDLIIRLGDSVTLIPIVASSDSILWESDLGDSCQGCPTFTVRPTESTVITATLDPGSPCAIVERLNITVDKRELIYIPTAFSPNGDGTNDVFRPYPGPAITRIKSFRIFDRWGNLVHQVEDLDPTDELAGWDGRRANGQDPQVGVYVYVVEALALDGRSLVFSGEVVLIR